LLFAVSASFLSLTASAIADTASDAARCSGETEQLAPVNWVAACSAAINASGSKQDRAVAHYNRARAYRAGGDNVKAIGDYTAAIQLLPDFAIAFQNRGVAYNAQGEVDRAIADYSEAIRLEPKLAVAYNNRGVAYKGKGETDKAIKDLTSAIELDPSPWAFNNRGDVYFRVNDWTAAINDYTLALALNPKLSYALFARGAAKTHRGDRVSGRADMEAAVLLNPKVSAEQARDGIAPQTQASMLR
jgi:tetratricopeptide (TPR) repeat protein